MGVFTKIAHLAGARLASVSRGEAILEGAVAEEEVDDIAFVWLEPVEGTGGDRADIESIDIAGIDEIADPGLIFCDGGSDER